MTEIRSEGARLVAALALLWTCAAGALPAPAAAGVAAPIEVSSASRGEIAAPDLRVEGDQLLLTSQEAVRMALERNLGLQAVRYDRERARLGIAAAMGAYDLGLYGALSASEDESPAASNLDGADVQEQNRRGLTVGLSQLLPTGGTGSLQWVNGRFESNSQFAILNPSFSSGLDVSFSQPLLRGFGRQATEYTIEIARNSDVIARDRFVQQVTATIQAVENAYWSLVGSRYQLRVAEESLALARELHENNKTRVEVGTLAPLELVQSEAGIATREEEIIRARAAIGDAEDLLRTLLYLPAGPLWEKTIVPETEVEIEPRPAVLATALQEAMTRRPELAVQKSSIHGLALDAAFRRQELKPRLDLTATYGFNGVGGDVIVRGPGGEVLQVLDGGWGDALEQITDLDFPGWSIALEFRYPLQNRTAKARSAIAEVELEQGRVELSRLEQLVSTEVRTAVRGLETSRQQIESARVSVRLEEKNLDAERKKYENGLSTSFQILQVQESLTAARSRLVAALTGYRRALVEYHRAVGSLLEESSVRVAD